MDISQVSVVRSAKGNDMLCVDGFLYYYDDGGLKSYRWSCNRRKDKTMPCKSRIITKLIDNDETTKHSVVKVFGEHSHERCSPEEISKAMERKRVADLAGLPPSTLEAKAEMRKQPRDEEEEWKQHSESSEESSQNKQQMKFEYPVEETTGMLADVVNIKQEISDDETDAYQRDFTLSTNLESTVYMLKTSHGRDMICVDGYLYRFEGRAQTSNTYRWECCRRRDDGCKARIQTVRTSNNRHEVKYRRLEHTHPPYSQAKLIKLFNKHNISLLENEVENIETDADAPVEATEQFEEINVANSSQCLQEILNANTNLQNVKNEHENNVNLDAINNSSLDETNINPNDKNNPQEHVPTDDESIVEDPLEGIETVKTDLDLSKVFLIPSAKGNKMLSVGNFLYHFDSRSQNKKRIYWTCIHRRDKLYHCKSRITTESNAKGSLKIVKMSGHHLHSNDIDKIKKRLCNTFIARSSMKQNMKPNEILSTYINTSRGKFKEMLSNSTESIRQKITKMRYNMKRKNLGDADHEGKIIKCFKYEENDSDSSLSSALHSDDDMHLPILPTKLEQMKTNIKEDPNNTETESERKKCKECIKEPFKYRSTDTSKPDMDIKKMSTLRSAKGGELLCIDDFIYHVKSARDVHTYWECIKCKHKVWNCKSRVTTISTSNGYVVKNVTNRHSHPASKFEVQKRQIYSIASKSDDKQNLDDFLNLRHLVEDFTDLSDYKKDALERRISRVRSKMLKNNKDLSSTMKLYAVAGGPPSLAVKLTLRMLKIPYELIYIDYCAGEHMTEKYGKMNPQKEIPVLDDNGFYISESIAIIQYLCDKYAPHSSLYPKDATKRAVVNQRLCFNMGFYYARISAHVMLPIFFNYSRNETSIKKVNNALSVFETYLSSTGTKYVAADSLTIADLALVGTTLCLEAIDFDITPFPLVTKWYETFKNENPRLWEICNEDMKTIAQYEKNTPIV